MMRGRGVERLLCNPLGRARETARAVEPAIGVAAEIDADLAESDIGRWEALTKAEVEVAFPGELARREEDRLHQRPPGGESIAHMLVRARAVAGRLDERTTLIVAHSAINRVLVAALIGWEDRITDIYQPHQCNLPHRSCLRLPPRSPTSSKASHVPAPTLPAGAELGAIAKRPGG